MGKQILKCKRKRGSCGFQPSDTVCIVCQNGGKLLLCDHCSSAYHLSCIDLKDIPDGNWFCPSCRCGLCGLRDSDNAIQLFTSVCHQCTRQYHVDCLTKARYVFARNLPGESFCTENCFKLCANLQQLLGTSNPTSVEGLTWTLMRSMKNDCNILGTSRTDTHNELSRALKVMHECFEPIIDPRTMRDMVSDVFFNSVSIFRRLDFHGFYVVVLQKGDELISVATVRIYDQKVAEMPLIATHFNYRHQGMCRLLVRELEKMLTKLGVQKIILPASSHMRKIWEESFGFSEMPSYEMKEFSGYPFMRFQGTVIFQKVLVEAMLTKETKDFARTSEQKNGSISSLSLVCSTYLNLCMSLIFTRQSMGGSVELDVQILNCTYIQAWNSGSLNS